MSLITGRAHEASALDLGVKCDGLQPMGEVARVMGLSPLTPPREHSQAQAEEAEDLNPTAATGYALEAPAPDTAASDKCYGLETTDAETPRTEHGGDVLAELGGARKAKGGSSASAAAQPSADWLVCQ